VRVIIIVDQTKVRKKKAQKFKFLLKTYRWMCRLYTPPRSRAKSSHPCLPNLYWFSSNFCPIVLRSNTSPLGEVTPCASWKWLLPPWKLQATAKILPIFLACLRRFFSFSSIGGSAIVVQLYSRLRLCRWRESFRRMNFQYVSNDVWCRCGCFQWSRLLLALLLAS